MELHEKHREKVRQGIARYLLVRLFSTLHSVLKLQQIQLQDNSQMYEQWLALKREKDRKLRSSLTHKLGTVPLLHVFSYPLILAVYYNFQWAFFSSPDPCSWQCSCPN